MKTNYIERYVYAVIKRLPEHTREDVKQELTAHIYDMLGDDTSEENIEKVLYGLGHPRDIAVKYQPKERYLISPKFFSDYIYVLKIVALIFIIIGVFFGTIDLIIKRADYSVIEFIASLFAHAFSNSIEGIFDAFAVVTVVFVLIEYGYQKAPKEIFKLKNLPQLPKEVQMKIKRSDTMFSLIFSVIFGVIFLMILVDYHEYIGFYNQGVMTSSFFNTSYIETFIPVLAASIIISVIVHLMKLYDGQWTRRVLIAHTIYELISLTIVILLLNASKLIDPNFIQDMATLTEYSTAQVLNAFDIGFKTILSMITLIMVLQFGSLYYRYWKKKSK